MQNPTLHLICVIVALVLLALAGLNVSANRVSLGWWGLFFAVLALLVF